MEKIKTAIIILLLATHISSAQYAYAAKLNTTKIKKVVLEGNEHYKDSRISKLMITRKSGIFKKRLFYERNADEDIRRIEYFYENNGYLDVATSYEVRIKEHKKKKLAFIEFTITEGKIYKTAKLVFTGNVNFSDDQLRKHCRLAIGEPFSKNKLDKAVASLLAFYANIGFIEADIQTDLKIDRENLIVEISIYIDENRKYRIADTLISGNSKTRPNVINRELLFSNGEIINASKLLDARKKLYLTGLFSDVQVKPVLPENEIIDSKDILIELKEKMSVEL